MAAKKLIPVDVLRQLVRLDPDAGLLYLLPRGPEWFRDHSAATAARWNGHYAGKRACATLSRAGYFHGRILGRSYPASHVIFAMTHGWWPKHQIDHKNGVRNDNRPSNLREATSAQNNLNIGSRRGTSRFCGVSWTSREKKWRAVGTNAQQKDCHIGYFDDETDAALAYDAFAAREHGEFARLNFPLG